jgi:hypothetical protein
MKKAPPRRKPKTHFAQVPVSAVKRTIEDPPAPKRPAPRNLVFEPTYPGKTEPYSFRPDHERRLYL